MGKNVIIFEIDDREEDILFFRKDPTQILDDTTLTVEAQYSINFSISNKKNCVNQHYNRRKSFYLLMLQKSINSKQKILK